jgi:hypothetical protein
MASTYKISDAITYAQAICVGMPVAAIQLAAADMVNAIIWNAYPWQWARKNAPAIPLIDGQQDYSFATVADYMRLLKATLVRTSTTPNAYEELTVVRNLAQDLTKAGFRSGLSQVAYDGTTGGPILRLNQAAAVPAGNVVALVPQYQFQPVKITAVTATMVFPDQYFMVFCAGLLWQFYLLAKDGRAGTAQATKTGSMVYTGQMGIFYDELISMREAEDYGGGDTLHPSEPIGIGGPGTWIGAGIYGP